MKRKIQLQLFAFIAITVSVLGCTPYIITTGCIKDTFTIKFTDENITLVPDAFFNIKDLKFVENNYLEGNNPQPGSYKKGNQKTYKISILHNNKTYYGRIAFYNVSDQHKTDAVASYYRISIAEEFFQQVKGDQNGNEKEACIYEQCKGGGSATWVIWLSNNPSM
jgi:hypothetical protein